MDNVIELDRVDALGAGAIGQPGERIFYIQADKADARLTVVVEKEQVALLAAHKSVQPLKHALGHHVAAEGAGA